MAPPTLEPATAALLAAQGLGGIPFHLEPLSASGNNRVFVVHCGDVRLVAKWYFHDAADTRDRLGAEYAFLQHAWSSGLRCVPRPLGKDTLAHVALYEYVQGRQLFAHEVNAQVMQQAAQFFSALNSAQSRVAAVALPLASEACFSVAAHFAMVDTRLVRLQGMPLDCDVDHAAAAFVVELDKYWQSAKLRLARGCEKLGLDADKTVPTSERCLSPSDFGFHNALFRPDGSLCFIDFEYAGWDDPAKTMGDFFSHPGVAVPRAYFEDFLAQALAPFDAVQGMTARVRLLEPISQLKWCCIILNEFLPAAARRRNFANPSNDAIARKQLQLGKAISLFESLPY